MDVMSSARHFTAEQARVVGEAIGIDWATARFSLEEFRAGMGVELEHGDRDPVTDVTASDPVVTGKIALAHLNEFPDYYTRLARMEAEAEEHWRGPAPESPGLTARDVALVLGAVGATAGIGAAATTPVLESRWYRRLRKPPWQPPGAVFGPVWTVIYALIAASMLVVRRRGGDAQRPVFVMFGTNLALNLAWTLIFFRGRSPLAAGVEIVALEGTAVALVVRAWPVSRLASLLLVPYALWILFATALTWAIWARNARPRRSAMRVAIWWARRRWVA
jgi:tryptophan-rich sensory protein